MTKTNTMAAMEAVRALDSEIESLRSTVRLGSEALATATRRIRELEEARARPMVSALSRYTDVITDRHFAHDAYRIAIRANCSQIVISASQLANARDPIGLIDEHIETVVRMHSDDLRKQLRDHAWQIARNR